ncbi:hypothetical protein Goshw_018488, partial [Gossypium schwendimanii]|nr:hypothetical protein [Gossypium schwendimanii]
SFSSHLLSFGELSRSIGVDLSLSQTVPFLTPSNRVLVVLYQSPKVLGGHISMGMVLLSWQRYFCSSL